MRYSDLAEPPYDFYSRICAWVKYRGHIERGNWCQCIKHDRLEILLGLEEVEYTIEKRRIYFTLAPRIVNRPVYDLEIWWMRLHLNL